MTASCSVPGLSRRTFQTSDGVALSVLEAGREHSGDRHLKIVFVPGWSMPATLWRKQLEALGGSYHVLAIDPRGQGESQVPPTGYTAERRAADLSEILQPLSNVLLVGWSLGAIESLQYVQMFGADRLAGLVLVDSSVGEEPAPPPGGAFTQRLQEDRGKTLEEFVRAIFAKPRPDGEVDALVRQAKKLPLEESLALLSYPFERTHWRRIAHGFAKPLLYAVTQQFEAQALNLQKNRPATQIEIFKDAGHALFVDESERFNSLLARFAARLASP
ncbi:MAG: alpha/beta hydrolase [Deltaproteobacteria bacterium]|nr:alpha/beta hydrolase [Deltaproteobacteria bacterium]MDZ4345420.1 alpha/beta hydrolase [Candidatus Binatia bacterium]